MVLDKLKFWKKEEVDDFGASGADKGFDMGFPEGDKTKGEFGSDFGLGAADEFEDMGAAKQRNPMVETSGTPGDMKIKGPDFGRELPPEIPQQQRMSRTTLDQSPTTTGYAVHDDLVIKNIELVSSKIDALRAHIESLNQRVVNLERLLERMEESRKRTW